MGILPRIMLPSFAPRGLHQIRSACIALRMGVRHEPSRAQAPNGKIWSWN